MRAGERIAARVRRRLGLLVALGELLLVRLGLFNALVGDDALDEVDRAAGTIVLLHVAARRVRLAALEHGLEALAGLVVLAVLENRGERIVALASIGPGVRAAGGDRLARIVEPGEPRNGVDLVAHPLTRDAGRERPEEAELEVLARIELVFVRITVEKPHVPVDVLLLERGDELFAAAPAARLVHVPAEIDERDVAELAAVDVLLGGVVGGARAALRADLDHRARGEAGVALRVHRVLEHVGGVHVLGHRLLAVGVLARVDGVRRVLRMLEVGRGDDHGIDVLAMLVEIHVARVRLDRVAELLLELRLRVLVETLLPEVCHGDHVKVEVFLRRHECGEQRAAEAVRVAHARHADAVVRAEHVERRARERGGTRELREIPALD